MKKLLLYIETLRRGGAEHVMSILANEIVKRGFEVVLVTNVHDDDSVNQYAVDERVKRYYLDEYHTSKNVISKTRNRINILKHIALKEHVDVALSFMCNSNIRLLLALRNTPIKTYISVRNNPSYEYKHLKLVAKTLFKEADGIIFQTQDALEWFPKAIQNKSRIIYNPVDEKFFTTQWKPERNRIVAFGRIVEQKNYEMLVAALKKVQVMIPTASLHIYGEDTTDSGEKEKLVQLIHDFSLDDSVFFEGNVADVDKELSKGSVFVLCSKFEGLPNAMMEAMAVGVPVVATDCPCGGPRLLSEHGHICHLVPLGDIDDLAKYITYLLIDEEHANTISKKEIVKSQEFKTEKIIDAWIDFMGLKL